MQNTFGFIKGLDEWIASELCLIIKNFTQINMLEEKDTTLEITKAMQHAKVQLQKMALHL